MTELETLPEDVAALRALVLTAWAERDAERAEKARLADQNDRLRQLIRQLQRLQFGRHSERLDPDQFSLALEDLEQAVAATEAAQERADPGCGKAAPSSAQPAAARSLSICRGLKSSSSPRTGPAPVAAGRCT